MADIIFGPGITFTGVGTARQALAAAGYSLA
jgi:hypothetical protein